MRKWIVIAILIVIALPLVAAGGVVIWAMNADFRPFAERKLSATLERPVTIGALSITWGDPLTVEIHDVTIANPAWGEPAQMLTLGRLFARIDAKPLLHGTLRYQQLDIDKFVLVLERNDKGIGNWKFGTAAVTGASSGPSWIPAPAVVPHDRTEMSTMLNFTMHDSQVRYRTSSGRWLTIDLGDVALKTTDDDQPITIAMDGAYNKIPLKVQLGADSFEKLRQASVPFGMNFSVANDLDVINFRGTAMQPLDFDGVTGAMTIDSKKLGSLLKALDAEVAADFPLDIAGAFAHSGDHWSLDDAKGSLAGNAFTGKIALDEGPRGGTDHVAMVLDFDRLLLDSFVDKGDAAKAPTDPLDIKLGLPGKPSPEFQLQLSANPLQIHQIKLPNFSLAGTLGPGHLNVDRLRFPLAGATFNAKGTAKQQNGGEAVTLSADLLGANITDFLKTFDINTNEIAGKIDARAHLAGTGATLGDVLIQGDGEAVLAMREGKVSKDVLEKASTDLRTVFRKGEGMSPVNCLLGVAEIKNGVATIAPLTLRSPDAKLVGGGTIDLRKRSVDLVIKSDPKSTGFFALDIPIHISGPLAHPSAEPSSKAKLIDPPPASLAPETRLLAQQSGCAA